MQWLGSARADGIRSFTYFEAPPGRMHGHDLAGRRGFAVAVCVNVTGTPAGRGE